jgi:hypothetical protein
MRICIFGRAVHLISSVVVRLTLTVIFLAMASRVLPLRFVHRDEHWWRRQRDCLADVNGGDKPDVIEANGGITVFLENGDGKHETRRCFQNED